MIRILREVMLDGFSTTQQGFSLLSKVKDSVHVLCTLELTTGSPRPQALSSKTCVGGEPGNIHGGKLLTSGTLLWQHQSDCRTKAHVHVTFCPLSKKLSTRKCVAYILKAGGKQFSDVWKGRRSRESKFPVVGLRDRLARHTSQLRV